MRDWIIRLLAAVGALTATVAGGHHSFAVLFVVFPHECDPGYGE